MGWQWYRLIRWMFLSLEKICDALREIYGEQLRAVYDKSSGTAPFKAGLDLNDGYLYQDEDFTGECEEIVMENGHKFAVNWEEGQKTGFFLDQRENRALVERYAAGRNVLNLFSYTGGFSIYALAGGALGVDSVESLAFEVTDGRMLSQLSFQSSFFLRCRDFASPQGKYDMIIVDPPLQTSRSERNALRGYQRLNGSHFRNCSGGIIFTFSCSQVVL